MSNSATLEKSAPALSSGSGPKFGVVRFPGSNCDQDAYYAIRDVFG